MSASSNSTAIVPVWPAAESLGLPVGFEMTSAGVEYIGSNGSKVWLCSKLIVTSTFRDLLGNGWGRLVEVTDRDGMIHYLPLTDADLTSKWTAMLRRLIDAGLRTQTDPSSKKALQRLLLKWQPARCQTSTSSVGWVGQDGKAFVFGTGKVVGNLDVLPMNLTTSPSSSAHVEQGTLDEWRAEVGALCKGNDILILAVSTALAGVLLDFLDLDLGGGLHLKGASSQGKSTALRVATSVWGSPDATCSWRATSNGLEVLAASLNGTFLPLDELGEVDGRHLNDVLYCLANGVGKTRMTASQDMGATKRWRVSVLSTGEISIATKLAEGGKRQMAGQMVRLLDVTADGQRFGAFDELHGAPDAAAFADRLKRATRVQHGTAAVAFVRELIARSNKRDEIRSLVQRLSESFRSNVEAGISGVVGRAADRFAVIAIAGELATTHGITGWNCGEATLAAKQAFIAWHETRTDSMIDAMEPLLSKISEFCLNGSNAVVRFGSEPDEGVMPAAWEDDRLIYLPTETWHMLFPDAAGRAAAMVLREGGILLPGEGENLMRKASDPRRGRQRYYTIIKQRIKLR
ncbi:DUF927 domain-containing protein [Gemmobacter straminiformis]|uniref:DUF927 domain-containing protein n=2 Tax=Paragemmobacter straminiformis TaxID=2045119 RepID=A0A842I275_9RHOB|nr:DUF927 domain-containing protein [Gemmobacter straminiformis]